MVGFRYPVGTVYTCWRAQISNYNNSTSLESVQQNHLEGKINSDVRALRVESDATRMKKLPKNIEGFFPNLEVLIWVYGNLMSITADDLKPFPEMKNLALWDNEIVSLDSDLFQHSPMLDVFHVTSNKIANVGHNVLANLNELREVWFSNNPCISFIAQTPQQIAELKQMLVAQCPSLTTTTQTTSTTTGVICDVSCTVNDEIDELVKVVEVLEKVNNEQLRINDNQNLVNAKNEERISELEMHLREIMWDRVGP